MKDIKLKMSQRIRITRDRVGALDTNSRSEFETTVGAAFKEGDFATHGGTMDVNITLIDRENATYDGAPVFTAGRRAYAHVPEGWEAE